VDQLDHGSGRRATTGAAPHIDADGTNETGSVPNPHEFTFAGKPRQILHILLIVTAVLVVLSTVGQAMLYNLPDFPLRDGLADLLYVDNEQSLPTLYSSTTLLVAALLFGLVAYAHSRGGRAYVRHWAVLSIVFGLLALDEFGSIHELTIQPLRDLLDIRGGLLWFAWVIPGAIVTALLGFAFLRFLRQLPRATRRHLWSAAILFLGGAIGVEVVSGAYSAVHGELNMGYVLIVTIEETLEMLGIAALVYALIAYIPVGLPNAEWRLWVAASD
jgi:hypothetical protein